MYLGKHVVLDINNFEPKNKNLKEVSNLIFGIMEEAILKNTTMKIMHKQFTLLEEPQTENGWTSVLLLDASHLTSHAYSDKKIIAFDIFTCGDHDTIKVCDHIIHSLEKISPSLKVSKYEIINRFKFIK